MFVYKRTQLLYGPESCFESRLLKFILAHGKLNRRINFWGVDQFVAPRTQTPDQAWDWGQLQIKNFSKRSTEEERMRENRIRF